MVVPIFMAGSGPVRCLPGVYQLGSNQKIIGLIVNMRGRRMQAQLWLFWEAGVVAGTGRFATAAPGR
jgi:hypothetical protein